MVVRAFEKVVATATTTPGTTDICLNVGGQTFVNKGLAETISTANADIVVLAEYKGMLFKEISIMIIE